LLRKQQKTLGGPFLPHPVVAVTHFVNDHNDALFF